MTIKELESKLNAEGLLSIHDDDRVIKYIDGSKVYHDGRWHNVRDVFGIFKAVNGVFCYFISDSERGGIPDLLAEFKTEEEACEKLYEVIMRLERIYQDGIK